MRSSPGPSFGHGLRLSRYSIAERIELPLVARELLPLSVDDVRGRVLHEALVRKHALGAGDFLLQPLDLGRGIPVAVFARTHDGLEDAQLLALERHAHAAAAEHL